jgi:transcriptional regulator with XRE-family HTH domain
MPQAQNRNNPLRQLRECLSSSEKRMSQKRLSEILEISTETLKSIENGRFRGGIPSEKTMERILTEFGAVWSAENQQWEFLKQVPFTRASYELWKTAKFDRVTEIDVLCGGLISLLSRVSDGRFASASDAVYRALHGIAEQHRVSWEDRDSMRMDLAIVNVWRDGKNTRNPSDIVEFKRERDYSESFRDPKRERLDFRAKLADIDAASSAGSTESVKPASRPRSRRAAAGESPKTSSRRSR